MPGLSFPCERRFAPHRTALAAAFCLSSTVAGCESRDPSAAAGGAARESTSVGLAQASVQVAAASAPAAASIMQEPGGAAAPAAAAPAGGVAVQFEFDKDFGKAEASKSDAEQAAKKFVSQKGWSVGRTGSEDTGFLVVVGKGPITGGPTESFDQRRRQAAKEAMLQAKKAMVQYLAAEVSTSTKFKYVEGTPPLDEIASASALAPREPGALAKVKAILNHELDKQLKERNIDPSLKTPEQRAKAEEAARQAAKKILGSTEFRDAVNIAAEHELSGLQAFRTFESMGSGGSGKVAVVAVYSKKSAELHRALLGQGPVPTGAPQQSIMRWAESQGPDVLLYTHGVQVRTNEKGEVVLVAFGQSTAIGNSERQLDAAGKKARAQAIGELRRFMGELVMTAESDLEASSLTEFADDTSEFKSESRYSEEINARTEKLKEPGMLEALPWEKQHPQSDRLTKGSVMVWSVSEALAANDLGDKLRAAGGASGGAGIGTKRAPEQASPKKATTVGGKPSSGSGAEGEDP
ncbi:MAG: DUF6844 domain-containing protein [Chloroflexota bacterium]